MVAHRIEHQEGRSDRDIGFVGIDVSQATLDTASLPEGEPRRFKNDDTGIAAIVEWLKGSPVKRIVLEATGGYETVLATVLPVARQDIQEPITWLDERIARFEGDLDERLRKSEVWKEKVELLEAVPGVGKVTIFTLRARLPELGHLNRGRIAARAGVAPFNDDSGKRRGQRYIRGGRGEARCVLYLVTLTARRWNPAIKTFFDRLSAAGKPFKLAMTACMRKLLTLLNVIVKNGAAWKNPSGA
jgi:transposase